MRGRTSKQAGARGVRRNEDSGGMFVRMPSVPLLWVQDEKKRLRLLKKEEARRNAFGLSGPGDDVAI